MAADRGEDAGMTNSLPNSVLEERAAEQRRRLHNSVAELRSNMREKLDVKRNAREHFWPVTAVLSLVGLSLGFALTGIFTRD
jgi:hypothetical protein